MVFQFTNVIFTCVQSAPLSIFWGVLLSFWLSHFSVYLVGSSKTTYLHCPDVPHSFNSDRINRCILRHFPSYSVNDFLVVNSLLPLLHRLCLFKILGNSWVILGWDGSVSSAMQWQWWPSGGSVGLGEEAKQCSWLMRRRPAAGSQYRLGQDGACWGAASMLPRLWFAFLFGIISEFLILKKLAPFLVWNHGLWIH